MKLGGAHIYINTRGISSKVTDYLKNQSLYKYVTDVYGATTDREIKAAGWPQRKVSVLDEIKTKHKVNKNEIFFYDDTPENIKVAQAAGYKHSYLVINK